MRSPLRLNWHRIVTPNRSERDGLLLLPGSDALSRLFMRNSTQVGVDRFEIPIRLVAINWPR